MLGNIFRGKEQETEEHWVSISDVMAGLMVIFLFIAISYILNVRLQADEIIVYKNEIETLLDAHKSLHTALSEELRSEFEGTARKKSQFRHVWRGHLEQKTLSIRFQRPFRQGDASVPDAFRSVLLDFFPRYISILSKPDYKSGIAEIRIEGHTSSEWFYRVTGTDAYINNMELSQDRARNVLHYILEIQHSKVLGNREWLKNRLTANGLSSSQLILDLNQNWESPSNSYTMIVKETGIPANAVRRLHMLVSNELVNREFRNISADELVNTVSAVNSLSNLKPLTIERAISLLVENKSESRRVEFRVVTKSEKLIKEIEALMKRFNKSEANP